MPIGDGDIVQHKILAVTSDVDLSSTQLSKSIDMHDNDSPNAVRSASRSMLTSVSTFPSCQLCTKPHGNLTFPLDFKNNFTNDHLKNISNFDLLNIIKQRIKCECDHINQMKLILIKNKSVFKPQENMLGERKLYFGDLKFPVKSKESKSYHKSSFPCRSFDIKFELEMKLPVSIEKQKFPLKLKSLQSKFPCNIKKKEINIYDFNKNAMEYNNLIKMKLSRIQEILKNGQLTDLQYKKIKSLQPAKYQKERHISSIQFRVEKFPFEIQKKQLNCNKFPSFHMEEIKTDKIVKDIKIERTIRTVVFEKQIKKPTHAEKSPSIYLDSQKFPFRFKRIINKFPFKNKCGDSNIRTLSDIKRNLILTTLQKQTILPNVSNKFTFPVKEKKVIRTFPLIFDNKFEDHLKQSTKNAPDQFKPNPVIKNNSPLMENVSHSSNEPNTTAITSKFYGSQELLKSYTFPLKLNQNSNKFPFEHKEQRIFKNFSLFEIKQEFHFNKITHSLQSSEIFNATTDISKTFTKFPLKERVFKKFFRKFPNETNIPLPHGAMMSLNKTKDSIDQQRLQKYFANFPNIENLNKQQQDNQNLTTKFLGGDDTEKHASQVQLTQQVHKEKLAKTQTPMTKKAATTAMVMATKIPRPVQQTSSAHNQNNSKNFNVMPAKHAKNISLTTTKTAREVGQQYTETFKNNDNVIIFNRDQGNDSLSLAQRKNIQNSSFNHQHRQHDSDEHECECDIGRGGDDDDDNDDDGGILRASTPPMSAITSVQNTERQHDHASDLGDPQVAHIVECSSEVRDTFSKTVVNYGGTLNSSRTGSILDKNQETSLPSPTPQYHSTDAVTSPASPQLPQLPIDFQHTTANIVAYTPNDTTSQKQNCLNSNELLPKYSVVELCESNVINCPEIDTIEIIGVTTDDDSVEKESAVGLLQKLREDHEIYESCDSLENLKLIEQTDLIYEFELEEDNLDLNLETNEMKFEMNRSKGALPSSAAAAAGRAASNKLGETVTGTNFNRAKPYGTPRSSLERNSTYVPGNYAVHSSANTQRTGREYTPISLRGSSDSSSINRPTTATRRLSNDYSSTRPASPAHLITSRSNSNIPASSSSQRHSYSGTGSIPISYSNDEIKTSTLPNRYTNDKNSSVGTETATSSGTSKLKYKRKPTSGIQLSLDLPNYLSTSDPLTETATAYNRGLSLDNADILPARTRLRRQRRFRPQDSQEEDEDALQRLNRLKARISASLSEVKGVLKQYSTEEEGQDNGMPSFLTTTALKKTAQPLLEKVKEEPHVEEKEKLKPIGKDENSMPYLDLPKEDENEEENDKQENTEEGPVVFRFVKKIRRRSFYDEDEDKTATAAGKDEVDKSVGNDEADKCLTVIQTGMASESLNLSQTKEDNLQENTPKAEQTTEFRNIDGRVSPAPVIKIDKTHIEDVKENQDVRPEHKSEIKSRESSPNNNKTTAVKSSEIQNEFEAANKIDVNKSEIKENNLNAKPTKKTQNHKATSNKIATQQNDMKPGKSVSKIPQRTETKSTKITNELEIEKKLSESAKSKNDEHKKVEPVKNDNIKKGILEPLNSEIPKNVKSVDDYKTQEINLSNKSAKEISPKSQNQHKKFPEGNLKSDGGDNKDQIKEMPSKIYDTVDKVEDRKGKEIESSAINQQIPKQHYLDEKDLKVSQIKEIKNESSPSSALKAKEVEEGNDKEPKAVTTEEIAIHIVSKTKNVTENDKNISPQPMMTASPKPPTKIEGIKIADSKLLQKPQPPTTDSSELSDKEITSDVPIKLRKKTPAKIKDHLRRASLAAVEGSKIEPPVRLATPAKIQRRPSDSEAMVKKKLITTKTTTSGSIEEVTPKPKMIAKLKRSSIKKPPETPQLTVTANDSRHELATMQVVDINLTNKRPNDQRLKQEEAAASAKTEIEANKTIQGDKNKDVTMPNYKMPTQKPPLASSTNNATSANGQINRTQLMINEATMSTTIQPPPSSPTLSHQKTIKLDASSSRTTNENATATTTNHHAANKFENSEGGAMLANSKITLVSSTTASAENGPKQSQEDLHDLLQQESVIFIKTAKTSNASATKPESSQLLPAEIVEEALAKQLNETLEITQQQVVTATDIIDIKSNDNKQIPATTPQQQLNATAIDKIQTASAKSSVTANQQTQQIATTTTTASATTIGEDAATKINDAPQISISSQETTGKETTQLKATTQETTTQTQQSKGLQQEEAQNMPELQVTPAPVQTAELPHGPHKKKVVVKKIVRQNSLDKAKKVEDSHANEKVIENSTIPEIILDHVKDTDAVAVVPSATEDLSEATELSTEESSSQSEAGAAAIKPKKVRKVKKKVIIKRQKRRLSVSGDSFFNHDAPSEVVNTEVETLEKPIAFVSDEDEPEEEPEIPVTEEKKPLKPCISKKEFEIGDEVLFGERVKRTQIKWRKGKVKERTSCISYLLDIDGEEVSSHVNYLKRSSNRKVNFGGKEYLEIDYEQLAEDEDRAERVKQRTFSIWNMV